MRALFAMLFVTVLLAGCGQKGPLYLPEEPQQPSPEIAADDQA